MSSNPSIEDLCAQIQSSWPLSLPKDSWYIPIAGFFNTVATHANKIQLCTLTTVNKLDSVLPLYSFLFSKAPNLSKQKRLSAQIQDVLFKQVVLIGIVRPLMALLTLAALQREIGLPVPSLEDQKSASRYMKMDESTSSTAMRKIGRAHMERLYEGNLEPILQTAGAIQADLEWLEERIIYGMFLSDMSELQSNENGPPLNAAEVSLITVSSIMSQDVGGGPPRWHVRGLMRLGINVEDAEKICDTIKLVAKWAGLQGTETWIRASEVAPEI